MKTPIFTGKWGNLHIQGIAVDRKNGYIYYSFTTKLVKARLDGEIVGYVDGLVGHLGCIAFNERDGKLYGSLEYKSDAIGRCILQTLGETAAVREGFYVAIFDVDKIDRPDMSAEESGVMRCVYLREVVEDYLGEGKNKQGETVPHRYGCSGIDGTTFAPLPGKTPADGMYLYVSYGVYSDQEREDNDHQVLLCYDVADWAHYAKPLVQTRMHTDGPERPLHKFFVYTGNTTYGVQNLEYNAEKNALFMAVYRGKKPQFPNFYLYIADLASAAAETPLRGIGEMGLQLPLLSEGEQAGEIWGQNFPYGATGLCSLGGGEWLVSHNKVLDGEQCAHIHRYFYDNEKGFILADEAE
jgi:hypothetical protein